MSGPNPASEPEEYERITVHYSCGCFKKRYRVKVQTANYPEPTEIWSDSGCWRCDERADREGAAAEGAAMEAARRRRAGLRGRLRGIVRGRRARVP